MGCSSRVMAAVSGNTVVVSESLKRARYQISTSAKNAGRNCTNCTQTREGTYHHFTRSFSHDLSFSEHVGRTFHIREGGISWKEPATKGVMTMSSDPYCRSTWRLMWHFSPPLSTPLSPYPFYVTTMARYHETPTRAAANKTENSQRYSLYQPVNGKAHRKQSMSKHGDKAHKERELTSSRGSTDPATGRRRATMRSKEHDDEEEQIRKAIEQSKREVESKRNGKRSRDDSEECVEC